MLMKLRLGVNFINVLPTAFMHVDPECANIDKIETWKSERAKFSCNVCRRRRIFFGIQDIISQPVKESC